MLPGYPGGGTAGIVTGAWTITGGTKKYADASGAFILTDWLIFLPALLIAHVLGQSIINS